MCTRKLYASLPYMVVTRKIEGNKQSSVEEHRILHLYEHKIISFSNQFLLEDVWDISYRTGNTPLYTLYLHTNQGLYSFRTKTAPTHFIREFLRLQK